jgi:hypothetical protein
MKHLKSLKISWVLGVFALLVGVSSAVYALQDPPATGSPVRQGEGCYSTCGGEIPWPFQVSNQAVELSDGERYLLLGKVVIQNNRAYFEVDLVKHAWLSTARRRQNPLYVLEGDTKYWSAYEGKRIRLVSTAQWAVVQDAGSHEFKVEVVLSSLADPAVTADPPPAPNAQGLR